MAAGSDLLDEVFFNAEVDEKVVSDLVGSLESELTGSGHGNSEVKGRAVGNHIARAGIGGNSSNDQESKMGRAQEVAKAGTGVHGGVVNTRSRGSAEDATITGTTSATGSDTLANHSQGKTAAIVSTLPKHGLKIGSSGVQTLNGGNAMDSHSSGCSTALTATPVASSSASNTSTVTVANTGMVKGHANVILPASSNTVIQTSLVNPQTVVTTSTLGSGPTVTIVRSSMQTAGSAATLNMNNAGLTTAANVVNQPSSAASGSPKTILQTSQTISSAVVTNTGNLTISPAALGKNVVFQTVTRTATPGTVASSPGGIRAIAPQVLAPRLPQTSPNQPNIQNIQLPPGMVLVRSESGQLLMIHQQTLAQMQAHSQSQSAMAPRPATPASMTLGQISSAQAPGTPVMARQVTPASIIKQSSPTPTSMAGTTALQRPQETMENVKKCKNFLSTLIKLASSGKQSTETATNVKDLVKSLLEGKIEAEDFTSRLYRELNSSPQPFLVPFLKRSLPALRQLTPDSSAFILQSQGPAPCAHLQPAPNKPAKPAAPALQPQQKGTIAKSPQVTLTTSPMVTLRGQPHSRITVGPPQVQLKQLQMLSGAKVSPGYASLAAAAQRTKLKDGVGGTFRDDDDINDVTSMAGVNLSEENARILATNSELVGAVTRSWKDQVFLYAPTLHRRVLDIGRKYGLTELGPEVVTLVSHATQQRLQSLLEKVSEIAQQKNISFKEDGRYAQTSDVRAQLKFFEQLDQMEKQRKEEQEREILLKAAKSRSKQEDPEQLRLKQKAKEMQQQELFQLRQREANLTALAAIGPRKKRKLDSSARGAGAEGSGSSASLSPSSSPGASRHFSRQRITRVNLRDLLFCLENERDTGHSQTLYRGLLK